AWRVYVVDDACPDGSGALVEAQCRDPRVRVVRNQVNLGVGGAVMAGYAAAIADGADVIVKLDGDGQMDPALLPALVAPILAGDGAGRCRCGAPPCSSGPGWRGARARCRLPRAGTHRPSFARPRGGAERPPAPPPPPPAPLPVAAVQASSRNCPPAFYPHFSQ